MMASYKKISIVLKATIFILGGSGILILAGCSSFPPVQDRPDQPVVIPTTSTSSGSTPIKETATVVPTEGIPTSTWTPTPSPTIPAASSNFGDTFDDNRNNWHTDPRLAEVEGGKYIHRIDCPVSNVVPECGIFIKMPFTFPRNFRMEIDATLVKASTDARVRIAFEVRRSAEYYYINYSLTDGLYQISRVSQFGIFEILPETSTDFIETAVGESNKIGIEIKGTSLTPLINDHELAPAFDGKLPKAGESYLVILVGRGHSAELEFDNLTVQEVK